MRLDVAQLDSHFSHHLYELKYNIKETVTFSFPYSNVQKLIALISFAVTDLSGMYTAKC